jgi:hypothetical protein
VVNGFVQLQNRVIVAWSLKDPAVCEPSWGQCSEPNRVNLFSRSTSERSNDEKFNRPLITKTNGRRTAFQRMIELQKPSRQPSFPEFGLAKGFVINGHHGSL